MWKDGNGVGQQQTPAGLHYHNARCQRSDLQQPSCAAIVMNTRLHERAAGVLTRLSAA